jgi:hypothetical protein
MQRFKLTRTDGPYCHPDLSNSKFSTSIFFIYIWNTLTTLRAPVALSCLQTKLKATWQPTSPFVPVQLNAHHPLPVNSHPLYSPPWPPYDRSAASSCWPSPSPPPASSTPRPSRGRSSPSPRRHRWWWTKTAGSSRRRRSGWAARARTR